MCQHACEMHVKWVTHTFASLENERDTFPPGVVNPERGGSVRGADGVWRDSIVIEVPGLAVRRDVLAKERVVPLDGWDRAEDLHLQDDTDRCERTCRVRSAAPKVPSRHECLRPRRRRGAPW